MPHDDRPRDPADEEAVSEVHARGEAQRISVLCSASTPSIRCGWPCARFTADPDQILITLAWIWPCDFPRDELMPLRIEDGCLVVQSKRTGRRVFVRLDMKTVLPILRSWGYPVWREVALAMPPAQVKQPKKQPDPPL
jgi:hypothetical protein